jgi:hypothetical protein
MCRKRKFALGLYGDFKRPTKKVQNINGLEGSREVLLNVEAVIQGGDQIDSSLAF